MLANLMISGRAARLAMRPTDADLLVCGLYFVGFPDVETAAEWTRAEGSPRSQAAIPAVEDEEMLEMTLDPAREALVKSLFEAFSDDISVPIPIAALESDTKASIGPAKESVLSKLSAMDANGDGMIEYAEMHQYFAAAGSILNEEEFGLILSDMRDAATTAQMIKIARAAGSGT